jgi:hypothetical protein
MPTGYTAVLDEKEEVSLKEFVYICSHAFIYDSSGIDLPKESEYSDHYTQKIKEILDELERIDHLSNSEAKDEEIKEREKREEEIKKYISDKKYLRRKYESMLHKVNAWIPPSNEHNGLKKFMMEQLNKSIEFDCDYSHYKPLQIISGKDWLIKKRTDLQKSLKYYSESSMRESEVITQRNNWIRRLRESFEGVKND